MAALKWQNWRELKLRTYSGMDTGMAYIVVVVVVLVVLVIMPSGV